MVVVVVVGAFASLLAVQDFYTYLLLTGSVRRTLVNLLSSELTSEGVATLLVVFLDTHHDILSPLLMP